MAPGRAQAQSEREKNLRPGRADTGGEGSNKKRCRSLRHGDPKTREESAGRHEQRYPTILKQIAQWHEEKQAKAVTELRQGNDHPDQRFREPDFRPDLLDQCLRVRLRSDLLEVRHHRAAGEGEEKIILDESSTPDGAALFALAPILVARKRRTRLKI